MLFQEQDAEGIIFISDSDSDDSSNGDEICYLYGQFQYFHAEHRTHYGYSGILGH